jgi:peptide/nickel transport system ATP-binding protein
VTHSIRDSGNDAMTTLLSVEQLMTWFDTPEGQVRAVDGVDFQIRRGETLALLGESGCGKSISALSLVNLVPAPAGRIVAGRVVLEGRDLRGLSEYAFRRVRGKRIGMIFQEPQSALNPVLTIGEQVGEALSGVRSAPAARQRVIELLKSVGIADPEKRYGEYPHQLSGGMKQRAMIAMAIAAEPELLIADEPTTALDVTIQAQILGLLRNLQQRTHMAMLLITHDLGVVAQMADRVAVMYAGQIVEVSPRKEFFTEPHHPYSRKLFRSVPGHGKRGGALEVIAGSVPDLRKEFAGCRFAPRCTQAWEACYAKVPRWIALDGRGVRCHLFDDAERRDTQASPAAVAPAVLVGGAPQLGEEPLLLVRDLKVHFPITRGVLQRVAGYVRAVDGVSLAIGAGRTLALVGESGCGKTTVGKGILQLIRPSAGSVIYDGQELTGISPSRMRALRRQCQVVFQDPYSSLNPRMQVGAILEEGMRAQHLGTRDEREAHIVKLLLRVGLPPDARQRYPHEFSGGQRQRISIARALAVDPRLIVCDEPTSALDVSVQAQILNLLKELQDSLALSYLFITHNISVVEYLAHEVAVMYLGRIIERGAVEEVFAAPRHPYTQALLAAVPRLDSERSREVIRMAQGDMPSPSNPPSGCHFHPRCSQAMPECRVRYPEVANFSDTHSAACHLYPKGPGN